MIVYTQWFPAHEVPVRPGLYQVKLGGGVMVGLWNGYDWHKPKCAFGELMTRSTYLAGRTGAAYEWRGITQDSHQWLNGLLPTKKSSSEAPNIRLSKTLRRFGLEKSSFREPEPSGLSTS